MNIPMLWVAIVALMVLGFLVPRAQKVLAVLILLLFAVFVYLMLVA